MDCSLSLSTFVAHAALLINVISGVLSTFDDPFSYCRISLILSVHVQSWNYLVLGCCSISSSPFFLFCLGIFTPFFILFASLNFLLLITFYPFDDVTEQQHQPLLEICWWWSTIRLNKTHSHSGNNTIKYTENKGHIIVSSSLLSQDLLWLLRQNFDVNTPSKNYDYSTK